MSTVTPPGGPVVGATRDPKPSSAPVPVNNAVAPLIHIDVSMSSSAAVDRPAFDMDRLPPEARGYIDQWQSQMVDDNEIDTGRIRELLALSRDDGLQVRWLNEMGNLYVASSAHPSLDVQSVRAAILALQWAKSKPDAKYISQVQTPSVAVDAANRDRVIGLVGTRLSPTLGRSDGGAISLSQALAHYIPRGSFSFEQRLAVAKNLVGAVHSLHELGLTHGCISADSVYVRTAYAEVIGDSSPITGTICLTSTGLGVALVPPNLVVASSPTDDLRTRLRTDIQQLLVVLVALFAGTTRVNAVRNESDLQTLVMTRLPVGIHPHIAHAFMYMSDHFCSNLRDVVAALEWAAHYPNAVDMLAYHGANYPRRDVMYDLSVVELRTVPSHVADYDQCGQIRGDLNLDPRVAPWSDYMLPEKNRLAGLSGPKPLRFNDRVLLATLTDEGEFWRFGVVLCVSERSEMGRWARVAVHAANGDVRYWVDTNKEYVYVLGQF